MIEDKLNQYLDEINHQIKQINNSLRNAPEGRIRSQMAKGKYPAYYHVRDDFADRYPQGKYISGKEAELAKALAQKEYDLKLLALLQIQQKCITQFLKHFQYQALSELFMKFPEAKKRIIEPRFLPDDLYIEEWYKSHPGLQNPMPIEDGFITEKGELVRSKSEKIIADKLYYENIPYVYEPKVCLITNEDAFSDFVILNVRTREEFYHEHLGMMDNSAYCKRALLKLEKYEQSGLHLGENLIITMECSGKSFSTVMLDSLIRRYYK